MLTRTSEVFLRACPAFAAGLLALGASGCSTPPSPPLAPSPQPAAAEPAAPAPQPPPPRPPAVVPSPASVPGRVKLALVSSWLWMDGKYVGRLERLDYVRLLARVRDRRAAAGDTAEAKTLELEVDAATDWQNAHYVLGLCDQFERVELITTSGRFSLRIEPLGPDATPEGARDDRTVVIARSDSTSVWSGKQPGADASAAAEAEPEKLLEVARNGSHDELDAGLRRVCSDGGRCARVAVYFEEGLNGRELVRVLESLQRAVGSSPAPLVIGLALPMPPPPGEEATAFMRRDPGSGRLPLVVIRQVVRGSYGPFRDCFEGGLARHPKLTGLVKVRFIIERDGTVSHVADGGSDLPDGEVTQCMIQRFRGLRFPAPTGGVVTVEYPLLLRSG
jgi:hypothetical protein